MLNGNVFPQIEPSGKGIHLLWFGPYSWIYSLKGWNIQRRLFSRRRRLVCESISGTLIDRLRVEKELRLPFGWLSHRTSKFDNITPAEVFRLDLDETTSFVQLIMTVKIGFSFALFRGKVVSEVSPKKDGSFIVDFSASAIDAIVSYVFDPQTIQYCISRTENDDRSWDNVPFLIENLQLPITELDPSLQNADQEFQEAQSRLLPGENIDPEEFRHLVNIIRPTVKTNLSPRHIDKTLLLRENEDFGFEELFATVPLLSIISHPKWRRVMGFGWFDDDNALEPGQVYEYRITGFFPIEDLKDKIYGFHTISSNTSLPSSFFLGDLALRFSQPPLVELAPGTSISGKQQLSRRGIAIHEPDQFFWQIPNLQNWSLILDFPNPTQQIQFEFQKEHDLEYEAWDSDQALVDADSMPDGEKVELDFNTPINQIRIKGKGFLFAIRITQALKGIKPVTLDLPPVLFANTPRVNPPQIFESTNLHQVAIENVDHDSISTSSAKSAMGFQLEWEPSYQNGLTFWPHDEPILPPVESTIYQIEHREIPNLNWTPLLPDENWLLGNRKRGESEVVITHGVNLMELFPDQQIPRTSVDRKMSWKDVFDFKINDEPIVRPVPELGTTHQYRIRGIDIIGRSSIDWKESNLADFKKLLPPPQPVGLISEGDNDLDISRPNGVHARLLIKDAPDLTSDELELLGNDDNVIILKWGWHKEQRELDPLATEFRVYIREFALDNIQGELDSVTQLDPGRFECHFQLLEEIKENEVKDSFIYIGGYPFYVVSNTPGLSIDMILERRKRDENGQLSAPELGPVSLPMLIGSDRMEPQSWTARIGIVPLSDASAYSFEIRNSLNLSDLHSREEKWVGVSSGDDQSYVPDKLSPLHNRNGNESPIVPVKVQGRFWGRPEFDIPPPLEPVPRLVTREPEDNSSILFEFNVLDFIEADILNGVSHMRLERAEAGSVIAHYRVASADRLIAVSRDGRPEIEVTVPNPEDKNNIIQALQQPFSSKLVDQYLVFLAGSNPYRENFFEPVTPDPVKLGPVTDQFLPQTNRYVYRIKTGNRAGLISDGDAMLKVMMRIPSKTAGPLPELIPRQTNGQPGLVEISVGADEATSHVAFFYSQKIPRSGGALPSGTLLRVTNRRDLYPDKILRFRTPQGAFAKQLIKNVNDQDIEVDDRGVRKIPFLIDEQPGTEWQVWTCTITEDGVSSEPAGPWRILIPNPQL